jgi:hypothetical protein
MDGGPCFHMPTRALSGRLPRALIAAISYRLGRILDVLLAVLATREIPTAVSVGVRRTESQLILRRVDRHAGGRSLAAIDYER